MRFFVLYLVIIARQMLEHLYTKSDAFRIKFKYVNDACCKIIIIVQVIKCNSVVNKHAIAHSTS